MFVFVPAILGSRLELEDGLGNLLLESGDELLLESSDTPVALAAFWVVDENPVLPPPPQRYWHQSTFFQGEPNDQVNPVYFEAWQNPSTFLMPEIAEETRHGTYSAGMSSGNWEVLQLAPPVFDENGEAVSTPTDAELINRGAGETEEKGPTV